MTTAFIVLRIDIENVEGGNSAGEMLMRQAVISYQSFDMRRMPRELFCATLVQQRRTEQSGKKVYLIRYARATLEMRWYLQTTNRQLHHDCTKPTEKPLMTRVGSLIIFDVLLAR
jgi:hypothetical protein